jgi:YHS domain-containing protein
MQEKSKTETTYVDPVCEMEIEESEAAGTAVYDGETYYFCSLDCKNEFEKNPEEYV